MTGLRVSLPIMLILVVISEMVEVPMGSATSFWMRREGLESLRCMPVCWLWRFWAMF